MNQRSGVRYQEVTKRTPVSRQATDQLEEEWLNKMENLDYDQKYVTPCWGVGSRELAFNSVCHDTTF